jgi:hypothetical protein
MIGTTLLLLFGFSIVCFFLFPFILRAVSSIIWFISTAMTKPIALEKHFDEPTAVLHTITGAKFITMLVGVALTWVLAIWIVRFFEIIGWPFYVVAALNTLQLYRGSSAGLQFRG